jgi:hypothetical protein
MTDDLKIIKCYGCKSAELKARAKFIDIVARAERWEIEFLPKPKYWRSAHPWKAIRYYCPACSEARALDAWAERWLTS